jgi:hypothetical protein
MGLGYHVARDWFMAAKSRKKKTDAAPRRPAVPEIPRGYGPSLFHSLPLKYQIIASILLLIAAICLLYPELVFQQKVFVAGDVEAAASFASPIQQAMEEENVYPLWNPYLFAGMPSYESLAFNPYVYPVGMITAFLVKFLHFPNYTWLLFHTFLLGFGVVLLLMEYRVNFLIATAAGILMMWMPNLVAVGANGHGSQASAVAYMPYALLFWDRLWRGKGVLVNASALVILLGFQMLRAHLQISYYTFALIGLHLLFFGISGVIRALRGGSGTEDTPLPFLRRFRSGGGPSGGLVFAQFGSLAAILAVIVVGALLVSAVLFLPVHDYAQYSIRGASEGGGLDRDYATSWSLHPWECLTFILPFSFGFGKLTYYGYMPFTDYPNYIGLVVLIFSVCAVFIVKTRFVRFLFFVAVISTLVAFGKFFPILYEPLFRYLPYFNKFRVPVMVLIVQQLALVLLFGIGLHAVLKADRTRGQKAALRVVLVSVGIIIVVAISQGYWTDGFPQSIAAKIRSARSSAQHLEDARLAGSMLGKDLFKFSLILFASSIFVYLYFRRTLNNVVLFVLIFVIALLDLYMVSRHILHPEALFGVPQYKLINDKQVLLKPQAPDDVIRALKQDAGYYRVFPMGDFSTNRYMHFRISSIGGYHAAKLAVYNEFLMAFGTALKNDQYGMMHMLNVRYLVAPSPMPEKAFLRPFWQGVDYKGGRSFIYENVACVPRVFIVDRYQVIPGREALDVLAAGAVDFSSEVLLEKEPGIQPVSAQGARASIRKYGLNEIHIDAELPSPAMLVLSEIFYPRWKVFIDGEPGEIIRANHILRSVALPEGKHDIVFRYDASLLRASLAVSVAATAVALLLLLSGGWIAMRGRIKWKHSS